MSSAPAPNAAPTAGGSGRPRMPGWWWKRRKERLRKQRQAAENLPGGQENQPTNAAQNNPEAGGAAGAKKKKNRRKRSKKKKKAKNDNPAQPGLTPEVIEEDQPIEILLSDSESDMMTSEPLRDFFAQYEDFDYEPSIAPTLEFRRLCRTKQWDRKDLGVKQTYADFSLAIASQFNIMYGKRLDDLSAYQKLCARIGIDPIPDNLEEAKEKVCNTHVNIVDLTTPAPGETRLRIFPTEAALSKYTHRTKRRFPQQEATGTLLYSLLRRINDPPPKGSKRNSNNDIIPSTVVPEPNNDQDSPPES